MLHTKYKRIVKFVFRLGNSIEYVLDLSWCLLTQIYMRGLTQMVYKFEGGI